MEKLQFDAETDAQLKKKIQQSVGGTGRLKSLTESSDGVVVIQGTQLNRGSLCLALLVIEEPVALDASSIAWGEFPMDHNGGTVQRLQLQHWGQGHWRTHGDQLVTHSSVRSYISE